MLHPTYQDNEATFLDDLADNWGFKEWGFNNLSKIECERGRSRLGPHARTGTFALNSLFY